MHRRGFLKLAGGAGAAGLMAPAIARAQASWPDRPVKIIVPFAPGGATDLIARPWCDALGKAYGQQFVIENRGGASGLIGAEATFRSPPDGYTFLLSSNSTTVFQPQLRKINYDPNDFVVVARMGDSMSGFVVHPKHGFKTLKDMIDYAKKNPGKLTFGSSGAGTTTHMRLEALKWKAGIDVLHVPYRGGSDSLNDLLAGVIDIMNEGSTLPHAKAGKLTLLNINHSERFAEFPDVPTLAEAGVSGADVPVWFGLYAPPGTPVEISRKLNAKINEVSSTPAMKDIMQKASCVPAIMDFEAMRKHFTDDYASIASLIKSANIKLE